MSAESNKTMLVPATQQIDSLTNFQTPKQSYENFKSTVVSKSNSREYNLEGENSFLLLASNVFRKIDAIQNSYDIGELVEIRNSLINDFNYYTESCIKIGKENPQVMLARYILCAYSDELISTTYWGKDKNWANTSLLSHFYKETYGGDKFFDILEQLVRAPAKHIDLLELIFVCLSLGFEGKYRIQNRGKMELDSIRDSLYKQMKVMQLRERHHFYTTHKSSQRQNRLVYKTSYQVLAFSIVLMLALIYGVLTISLVGKENSSFQIFNEKYNKYLNQKTTQSSSTGVTNSKINPTVSAQKNGTKETLIKDNDE